MNSALAGLCAIRFSTIDGTILSWFLKIQFWTFFWKWLSLERPSWGSHWKKHSFIWRKEYQMCFLWSELFRKVHLQTHSQVATLSLRTYCGYIYILKRTCAQKREKLGMIYYLMMFSFLHPKKLRDGEGCLFPLWSCSAFYTVSWE